MSPRVLHSNKEEQCPNECYALIIEKSQIMHDKRLNMELTIYLSETKFAKPE